MSESSLPCSCTRTVQRLRWLHIFRFGDPPARVGDAATGFLEIMKADGKEAASQVSMKERVAIGEDTPSFIPCNGDPIG